MPKINLQAHAKINLTLDIFGKLPDTYHKIETIMHEISLCDEISIEELHEDKVLLNCSDKALENKNNLVYRAATLLKEKFNVEKGVKIMLIKRIPVGAGLGGGSSDGACVLKGLNEFWNMKLSNLALSTLAGDLGSDAPFFISGRTAFAFHRGEIVEQVDFRDKLNLLVINPCIHIDTKTAYAMVDLNKTGRKKSTERFLNAVQNRKQYIDFLHNDFEDFIFEKYPEIKTIKKSLLDNGALSALMSGSGSTVFGIFESVQKLNRAYEKLRNQWKIVVKAKSK